MKPVLMCCNVSVDFDGFYALQGADLKVYPHEVRFLIGPNGAGKTTLLDVICGKTRASNGKVLFYSHDITDMPEHKIVRLGISRKFQSPSIFHQLTVWENMELALKQDRGLFAVLQAKMSEVDRDMIITLLQRIELLDYADQKAGSLSHGQKQWLEIGMQLIQFPQLLLLDEPIAGMSAAERERTGELIHEIARDCAVVIVEHDMDFVRRFSKQVTVMHEGKVLCEGTMEDIQQNEKVVEIYLGREEKAC
ncbi:urea ABC transporter ATP-binding protein UrtD [Anoxybacteroides amylolyticum]|uniref:Urea ABC transporter, ATP-binding protein UrtD n=1 Tax=Anoxybacteroides amylolyticum TaxID=294699 RepID=A0A160F4N8_9BACL|nr:urea ABC transporter ATP-binding protein UrtD [Anoxybacillus amylolyticus]ANB60902.1 urea ABC transporter, ATP-binding protein UrtD [Anoxybacillus amylolyticus]